MSTMSCDPECISGDPKLRNPWGRGIRASCSWAQGPVRLPTLGIEPRQCFQFVTPPVCSPTCPTGPAAPGGRSGPAATGRAAPRSGSTAWAWPSPRSSGCSPGTPAETRGPGQTEQGGNTGEMGWTQGEHGEQGGTTGLHKHYQVVSDIICLQYIF